MKDILQASQVPLDFQYFRSSSLGYRTYLEKWGLKTISIGNQFGWMRDLFLFQIAKFERTDSPPTKELLQDAGFVRGMVLWIPAHQDSIPAWWKELWIPGAHFTLTGIWYVRALYYATWNERARRARRKFLSFEHLSVRQVTPESFQDAFKKTKVKHSFKEEYISYYRSMVAVSPEAIRSYVVYDENELPLAWLAVHDSGTSSSHLVAFTWPQAKKYQAGTGLIDAWYADSLAKGISYIHFDHLRDSNMTRDQQGYTDFKANFIEHFIAYPKCYFQFW